MTGPIDAPGERPLDAPASVASRTAFRLLSQLGTVAAALVGGIIIARRLGGDGKGVVSTLSYMVALIVPVAALGVGEAGVTLVRRDRRSVQPAFETTVVLLLAGAAASSAVLFLGASLLYHGRWSELNGAIIAAAVAAPLAVLSTGGAAFLEVLGRPVLTSGVRLAVAATSLVTTAILVGPLRQAVAGGVGAIAAGWAAGLVVLVVAVHRSGLRPRLAVDRAYLGQAVRLGVPIFIATVLSVAATRLDLVAVQAIAGDTDAGLYSVALNVAYLLAFPAAALGVAAHPRLAGCGDAEASDLIRRLARTSSVATAIVAVGLALVAPWGIPFVFGPGFRGAVGPALVLTLGGVLASLQVLLCRTLAARAAPGRAMLSLVVTIVVMLGLDVLLVPGSGIIGAAWASTAGSGAGLVALVVSTADRPDVPSFPELLPRPADVRALAAQVRTLVRRPSP